MLLSTDVTYVTRYVRARSKIANDNVNKWRIVTWRIWRCSRLTSHMSRSPGPTLLKLRNVFSWKYYVKIMFLGEYVPQFRELCPWGQGDAEWTIFIYCHIYPLIYPIRAHPVYLPSEQIKITGFQFYWNQLKEIEKTVKYVAKFPILNLVLIFLTLYFY